jgi:hypothetical protein
MQDIVVPAREYENMNSMIIKFFKNKTNLAMTAINSGIHWKEGYSIYHILDRQIQSHSKRILKALNNKDLRQEVLLARLQAAQNTSWSTTSILDAAGKTKFKRDSNLMGEILQLLSEIQIKFTNVESHNRIRIPECKLTLKDVMGDDWFQTHKTQLKKNRIMYIDQLANITGRYLLAWHQIKNINMQSSQGGTPAWYNQFKNEATIADQHDNRFMLKQEIRQELTIQCNRYKTTINLKRGDYIIAKKAGNIAIDKIKKKGERNNPQNYTVQHMKQIIGDSPLEKCYGCNLSDAHSQTCTWKARSQTTIKIPVTKTTESSKVHTSIIGHLPRLPESPDTIYRASSIQNRDHETEILNIQIPRDITRLLRTQPRQRSHDNAMA